MKSNHLPLLLIFLFISTFLVLLLLFSYFGIGSHNQSCGYSGRIEGTNPPPNQCNQENNSTCCEQGMYYSTCCEQGMYYSTYKCSPPVTAQTKAYLTLNSFEASGDGGGPSKCDNKFHSDDTPVVALSTGWFNDNSRCLNNITINVNGGRVAAMVVDECDSTMGCDDEHDYQPPCANNTVDASKAVWKALGVPSDQWGGTDITWSD